jgi:uncharacterized membrane protein YfcA
VSTLDALFVLLAGGGAGASNAVIGSGTLITFPVLLAVGYPPVTANVTNSVGLVLGGVTAAVEYRHLMAGHRWRVVRFCLASGAGALVGAVLLLTIPASAFEVIVPVLIALALVLVVVQPRISRWVEARRTGEGRDGGPLTKVAVALTGVYGGYFGAGQGILAFGFLGIALPDDLRWVNALRNLLAATNNTVAAVVFILVADVRPGAAALIAVGSAVGGVVGARLGLRLSDRTLRGIVVVVGLAAIAQLVL